MKLSTIGKYATLLILLLISVIYYLKPSILSYSVRGRVAGFSNDPYKVIIEHEAIKGYMEAMTMPFTVLDSNSLKSLEVGNAIEFKYYVKLEDGSTYIDQIQKLPENMLPKAGLISSKLDLDFKNTSAYLQLGDTLPNYVFINQSNEAIQTDSFRGKKLILTFIYTNCPVPDYCPLMSYNFKQIHDEIIESENSPMLLSISFDQKRDTPEVLKNYGEKYTKSFEYWNFVTADNKTIESITSSFSVITQTEENQIIHNLRTVLIDEQGVIQKIWPDNLWQADDVIRFLK